MKAIRQVDPEGKHGDILTATWAVNMANEQGAMLLTYLDCCCKSQLPTERDKYADSVRDALGKLQTALLLVGKLSEDEPLLDELFHVKVEIIEVPDDLDTDIGRAEGKNEE